MFGKTTVTNTGDLSARVDSVTDALGIEGVAVTVDCDQTLPDVLEPDEVLPCNYTAWWRGRS